MNVDGDDTVVDGDVVGLELEFAVFEDGEADVVDGEVELQFADGSQIDLNGDATLSAVPGDVDVRGDLTKVSNAAEW